MVIGYIFQSVFLTPEINRPADATTPQRPTKKLTILPAAIEADLDLLSKLTITDDDSEPKIEMVKKLKYV